MILLLILTLYFQVHSRKMIKMTSQTPYFPLLFRSVFGNFNKKSSQIDFSYQLRSRSLLESKAIRLSRAYPEPGSTEQITF